MVNRTNTVSAHTAGPWRTSRIASHIPQFVICDEHGQKDICIVKDCGAATEANALLMAAAPDLYKCTRYLRLVCEDRLSIEGETENDPDVIEHYEVLLADANAAIAKIEAAS